MISGSGRSLGGRNGNPLQYSCLGDSMNRGTWRAIVHGVTKESDMTETEHTHTEEKRKSPPKYNKNVEMETRIKI